MRVRKKIVFQIWDEADDSAVVYAFETDDPELVSRFEDVFSRTWSVMQQPLVTRMDPIAG